ncbi:hypothetical protein ACFLSQ_11440 [Bacteroidota bacterium]
MNVQSINQIYIKIENLKNDFENGSSVIAQKGLKIFIHALTIEEIAISDEKVKMIAAKIIAAKPAMASLKNIIGLAHKVFASLKGEVNPNKLYDSIQNKIQKAREITINIGIDFITNRGIRNIITCSYSSTVVHLFKELNLINYPIHTLALESIWKGRDYADKVIEDCNAHGISAEKIEKNKIDRFDIDCGIIGADAIAKGAGVINGIPSATLAEKLKLRNIPLFVIGESFKKTNEIYIEDGFQLVFEELIEEIFCDEVFDFF